MYKLKKGLLPVSIGDYFIQSRPKDRILPYNLRTRNENRSIPTRLVNSENSIHIRGDIVWNSIPEIITNSPSFKIFKRQIKAILIEL